MKSAVLFLLLFPVFVFGQSSTTTLNSGQFMRVNRTDLTVLPFYDVLIPNSSNLLIRSDGTDHIYFGRYREVTINRMPSVERALTVYGANNSSAATNNYVTSLWVESGSLNPANHLTWNVGLRIAGPRNPSTLQGWSIGNYTENFSIPSGLGHPYWYQGPQENGLSYAWNIDGYGNQWTFRHSSLVDGNWERGGCWWEDDEWYCGTQAANAGVKHAFVLQGAPVEIEDPLEIKQTIKIQGQPAFTGSCTSGHSPIFTEGIAVGCN